MTHTDIAISRAEIHEAAGSIEPLPAALSRLLSLLSSEDYDTGEVVEIMSHDPALAGDVLASANSAASGVQRRIGDMREATARVGMREMINIAMRRAMRQRFAKEVPAYGLGPDDLWRHCITASVAAEVIRKTAGANIAPMISTAALVHDVGKLVIAQCLPSAFGDALVQAAEVDSISFDEAERRVLGLDHGEVSGVVARTWGLPVSVQVALTQHHSLAGEDVFSHALVLADKLAHAVESLGSHSADETTADQVEDDASAPLIDDVGRQLQICQIDPDDIGLLVSDCADAAADILSAYQD